MKRSILFFTACLMTFCVSNAFAAERLNWYTNYDQAVQASKSSSKPLFLLFTGSDWCSWCKKLEKEVLSTSEFAQAAGDQFIFVMIDFPVNKKLPEDVMKQNKELQKKFGVSGYPTVLLLDSKHQKLIATTGYKAGGGKEYAKHLMSLMKEHSAYNEKMNNLDSTQLSGVELKEMYERATELGRTFEAHQIAARGISSDQNHFFMLERYRLLAEHGKVHSEEAQTIKQQLLTVDPTNSRLTHYQLAVIDFEASFLEATTKTQNPDQAVSSLVDYIGKFGDKDKENLWRLQMIISQVYFDEDRLPQALQYAESSYQSAPSTVQPSIASAIKNIQAKLK